MLFYVECSSEPSYSCFFVIGIVRTLCIQPFYTPWYCLSCNWINDPIFQGKFSNSFYVTRVLASFEFSVQRALLELHTLECMYMYIVWLPKLSSSLCSFFCWRQIASNKWDHNKTVWLPQLSCTSTITTGMAAAEMTMTTIYLPLAASSTTDFFLSTGLVVFCSIEKPIPKLCHQVYNNPIFGKVSRLLGL